MYSHEAVVSPDSIVIILKVNSSGTLQNIWAKLG